MERGGSVTSIAGSPSKPRKLLPKSIYLLDPERRRPAAPTHPKMPPAAGAVSPFVSVPEWSRNDLN